jgi:hypothetical protein
MPPLAADAKASTLRGVFTGTYAGCVLACSFRRCCTSFGILELLVKMLFARCSLPAVRSSPSCCEGFCSRAGSSPGRLERADRELAPVQVATSACSNVGGLFTGDDTDMERSRLSVSRALGALPSSGWRSPTSERRHAVDVLSSSLGSELVLLDSWPSSLSSPLERSAGAKSNSSVTSLSGSCCVPGRSFARSCHFRRLASMARRRAVTRSKSNASCIGAEGGFAPKGSLQLVKRFLLNQKILLAVHFQRIRGRSRCLPKHTTVMLLI